MSHLIDDFEFILIHHAVIILIVLIELLHRLVHSWHSSCLLVLLLLNMSILDLTRRLSHILPALQERYLLFEFLNLMLLTLNLFRLRKLCLLLMLLRLHSHSWLLHHCHLLLIAHHRLLLLLQLLNFVLLLHQYFCAFVLLLLSLPILILYFHMVINLILSFKNISLELFEFQISILQLLSFHHITISLILKTLSVKMLLIIRIIKKVIDVVTVFIQAIIRVAYRMRGTSERDILVVLLTIVLEPPWCLHHLTSLSIPKKVTLRHGCIVLVKFIQDRSVFHVLVHYVLSSNLVFSLLIILDFSSFLNVFIYREAAYLPFLLFVGHMLRFLINGSFILLFRNDGRLFKGISIVWHEYSLRLRLNGIHILNLLRDLRLNLRGLLFIVLLLGKIGVVSLQGHRVEITFHHLLTFRLIYDFLFFSDHLFFINLNYRLLLNDLNTVFHLRIIRHIQWLVLLQVVNLFDFLKDLFSTLFSENWSFFNWLVLLNILILIFFFKLFMLILKRIFRPDLIVLITVNLILVHRINILILLRRSATLFLKLIFFIPFFVLFILFDLFFLGSHYCLLDAAHYRAIIIHILNLQ